ncbi:hypothetical protein E4U10_001137, partial [Claviceps purpurea]
MDEDAKPTTAPARGYSQNRKGPQVATEHTDKFPLPGYHSIPPAGVLDDKMYPAII